MAAAETGNLFAELPGRSAAEQIAELAAAPGLAIRRIVSTGQASPDGFWFDQHEAEWVVVLQGAAAVELEGEAAPRRLGLGDWLLIPARRRHRVAWTDPDGPTVWLAVHFGVPAPAC